MDTERTETSSKKRRIYDDEGGPILDGKKRMTGLIRKTPSPRKPKTHQYSLNEDSASYTSATGKRPISPAPRPIRMATLQETRNHQSESTLDPQVPPQGSKSAYDGESEDDADARESGSDDETGQSPAKSKSNSVLEDFRMLLPELEDALFEHEHDDLLGTVCECNGGLRTVSCEDCFSPPTVCEECFIRNHKNNPFHWARVHSSKHGFFLRKDLSKLRGDLGYAIPLGHNGNRCPALLRREERIKEEREKGREYVLKDTKIKFTVVHSNGIHGTTLEFCECTEDLERTTQLLRNRLFPGSARKPIIAYTFPVLREYKIHSVQSKLSAQDFLTSLRRLSNNVVPSKVSVSQHSTS